jgi:predicted nucleic acid-binding protein
VSGRTIPANARVAIDTPAFIYFFEQHPDHAAAAAHLFTRLVSGELTGISSSIVAAELLVPYYRSGDTGRARKLSSFIHSVPNLEIVDAGRRICEEAARLRGAYALRTSDALHVATALVRKADWLVTNDLKLKRVEKERIEVWLFDRDA